MLGMIMSTIAILYLIDDICLSLTEYPIMAECNGGFGYSPSPHKMRTAAIFPSDIEDDDQRQSIPLTQDEQQPAEASGTLENERETLNTGVYLDLSNVIYLGSLFAPSVHVYCVPG